MTGIIRKDNGNSASIVDVMCRVLDHANQLNKLERVFEKMDRSIYDFVQQLNQDRTELLKRLTMLEARIGEMEKVYVQAKNEFEEASQSGEGVN